MKSLWLGVLVPSVLVSSFAACSSSSGDSSGGGDSGAAANDSGSPGSKDGSASSTGDSGGGGTDVSLSCNGDNSCVYYATIPQGAQSTDCPSPNVIVTSCPTTNVVATCAYNAGGTDQLITWYTGIGGNTATLKSTCDSLSGTFTAS